MNEELFEALRRGATLVTANHRLARSFRREFGVEQQRRGEKQWTEPKAGPWFGWLEHAWRDIVYESGEALPAALTGWQEEVLWERVIADSDEGDSLLQPAAAARAARQAWTIVHAWRLPLRGGWWEANRDSAAFLEWAREYQRRCELLGRIDPAVLSDFLRPRVKAPASLWLAGFDELTPQQRDMMEALESRGCAVTRLEPPREPAAPARAACFPDSESELAAAAEWARGLLRDRPDARIGIAVPGLRQVRAVASRVFRGSLSGAVHLSAGQPVAECPAGSAALASLELTRDRVPMRVVSSLLLSPFVGGAAGQGSARAAFEARLRSEGRMELAWRVLARRDECPAAMRRLLSDWDSEEAPPSRQLPSAWARTFSRLQRVLGWTAGDPRVLRAWEHVLAHVASLDVVMGAISASRALGYARRAAMQTMVEEENRGEPVQVMSLSETSGIEFDHLWITGLDASAWPRAAAPNPFIPVALQRERNLPRSSPARELDQARRLTRELLAAAGDVVVSWTAGEHGVAPSPLIARLPLIEWPRAAGASRPAELETLEETHAPPLIEGQTQGGGTRTLALQAACPFRAFAEIRLAARELEEPDLGLDARERGKALHAAMESLWRSLGGGATLRSLGEHALTEVIEHAVKEALRSTRGSASTPFEERLQALESRRLRLLLHEWLSLEKQRAGDFVALRVEFKGEAEAAGLRLRTRIDREDQTQHGAVLLDYKSGVPSVKQWHGDRPDDPQLPFYAVTREDPVAAVAFAQVRTGELRFKGYASAPGLLPGVDVKPREEFDAMLSDWRAAVDRLATEHREGRAEVAPKTPASCDYCHLRALCRIDARQGGGE